MEAYNLSGAVRKFSNRLHEYYAIGFVEDGKRHLWYRNKEYDVGAGDLVLFNPRDSHYCAPIDGKPLDYRAVSIEPFVMEQVAREITGRELISRFTQNVVYCSDTTQSVSDLYSVILRWVSKLEKEEAPFLFLEQVLQGYVAPFKKEDISKPDDRIQDLYAYVEEHFSENISLDELLSMTTFGKSHLLYSLTKQVGVSPYRRLQTIRLGRVKKFLEQGISPVEATAIARFPDQSHLTNFFKELIGLTPRQYQKISLSEPDKGQKERHHEA